MNKYILNIVIKRTIDIFFSIFILIISLPILFITSILIFILSPGPILFHAERAGYKGRTFSMMKFRTMHVRSVKDSGITAPGDARIFYGGNLIRKYKVDELPQFWNILRGEMSIVGPRPEDVAIVKEHYCNWMLETLDVKPGLTSPGAIYGYNYGEKLIDPDEPEVSYCIKLLPPKLALERAYIERSNVIYDALYIFLTIFAIVARSMNFKVPLPRKEIDAAKKWAPQGPY